MRLRFVHKFIELRENWDRFNIDFLIKRINYMLGQNPNRINMLILVDLMEKRRTKIEAMNERFLNNHPE